MGADLLGHLPADGHHRIERRHRVLEDHGDVAAAPPAHRLRRLLQQINAVEKDAAAGGRRHRAADRPITAWAVSDLPEPDSPTMQTIWLRPTSRLTSSTAKGRSAPGGSATVRFRDLNQRRISASAGD